LWLSIYTKGIYRIDREAANADEVPADAVKSIIDIDGISRLSSGYLNFDREGGLWVGTEKSLNRIAPRVIQTLSRKEGLEQDNVYPITGDSAGRVWAGVWPNNLARYENGRFKTILISNETVFITSLFEDASGRLWFGNIGNLSYLQGAKPIDFTGQAGFVKGTEFSAITQTGDGALWFGTNVGLSRYVNGLKLFKEVEDIDNVFPKSWENSVYRIVQETLNNIVKHSKASEVGVNVSRGRSEVSVIVKDDGVGFEPNAFDVSRQRIGFGLLGMSERAKLLGGRTTVESAKGAGTKVTVVLPLKADRASLSPGRVSR
jgi:ligand-binding sensor domain-containing protein